jgi:UDP-glucuronate 4-epimerase
MAKICITGGAGFIAFHLTHKLIELGHEVVGFDNYNDYYDPGLKHTRANILHDRFGVIMENVDLLDRKKLTQWMKTNSPDVVMHLAAYAGVRHSLDYPDDYISNNIVGTHNLIEACNDARITKITYASTSCVMADNPLPWNEDEKIGVAKNPYGYSKATNEAQMISSKIDSTIGLRFFTVYGPWGRPDMALFDFTKNIVAGNPIQLFNYGDMVRDFTYVEDIVQGIVIIINRLLDNQDINEIYNIGFGDQIQLVDFVEHIEKNLDRTAIRELVEMHPADTQATWSDTTKLQALGYKPTTNIAEGVAKFIEWYKEYYNVN